MIKHIQICLLFLFSINFATGPSNLQSEIIPISIDSFGDILCKYRFKKNENGGHGPKPIDYGYCILQDDSMVVYPPITISNSDPKDEEEENQQIYYEIHCDSLFYFSNTFNFDSLKQTFGFTQNFKVYNTLPFKKDTTLSISNFEKIYQISLSKYPQKTLHNKQSNEYFKEKTIKVIYDFGKIILTENIIDCNKKNTGVSFNYFYTWTNNAGKVVNIGYDMSWITGILFLK